MKCDPTRRLPAEWETSPAILIGWPHSHTDWDYMLDDVTRCYVDMVTAFTKYCPVIITAPDTDLPRRALNGHDSSRIYYIDAPSNDTWARDYGPITVIDADKRAICLDFKFNGWGLKFAACHDNLINRALHDAGLLRHPLENRLGFVLEGGSIESDGRGTILTTSRCLLSPNRNGDLTATQIDSYLCQAFGASRILSLNHGYLEGDDTDSHIDTLARLAPDDTILYVKCDNPADPHYSELKAMERELADLRTIDGAPYNLIGLPMVEPIYDEDGARLPATYANFLVTDRAVFMPVYGQKAGDLVASQMVKIAFPDHDVLTVDCRPLIRQHGSLHCTTMQIPLNALNL